MPDPQYASTDPNFGAEPSKYASTDPNFGLGPSKTPSHDESWFRPVEDLGSFVKGAANTVLGIGKLVTEGPFRAAQEAANQFAVDVGADQATGRSTVGSVARRGAEVLSPVPIAPAVKVARGLGYATHLTDTPEKPSEVAESIGELSAVTGLAKAGGVETDTGTTFGFNRPKMSSLLPKDTNPVNLMMRAVRPQSSRLRAPQAFESALRDLKKVEVDRGAPAQDLPEMIADIRTAKKANREQYAQLKDPKDAIGATVDTTPIAKAMVDSIPLRIRMQEPRAAAAIVEKAKMYEGRHPVDRVDTLLQEANAELESYFNKFPQARSSARTNPETASLVAEADALRTQLYKALDEPGGGTAARELQRRYGSLSELERAAQRRIITSQTKGADSYVTAYGKVSEIGHIARGGVRLLTGDVVGAGLDLAKGIGTKKAADYIANQQTPDALIRRALKIQKDLPTPVEMPPAPVIRGLLERGAIPLEAAPAAPEPPMAQRGEYGRELKQLSPGAIRLPGDVPGDVEETMARRGQYGTPWSPPPKRLPSGPSAPKQLERGAIPVGPSTKPPTYPPYEGGGSTPPSIRVGPGQIFEPNPSEWEIIREQPQAGRLSDIEMRELQRIADEMEAMPFQKRTMTRTGPYEQPEWQAGAAGAPVYDDILDAPDPIGYEKDAGIGKPSRGKMIADIRSALAGHRISRVAAKAIIVARARAVGGYPTPEGESVTTMGGRLSRPKLPPWWENR